MKYILIVGLLFLKVTFLRLFLFECWGFIGAVVRVALKVSSFRVLLSKDM